MSKKSFKQVSTIVIVLMIFIGLYYLLSYITRYKESFDSHLKNYKVNEYIPTYVSDEAMAKIYLNDYMTNMMYNTEESYYMLDEEYRNARFGSYQAYYNYIKNSRNYNAIMDKFYIKGGGSIFGIYDQYGNYFGFKTNGVMQYSVFLDEDTVEIR